jgi:opacity protein-like surface antigen
MRNFLFGAVALASLAAVVPASAQVYGVQQNNQFSDDSHYGAQSQARSVTTQTSRARVNNQNATGNLKTNDPDAFVRDYMRTDPLGSQD